MRQKQHAPHTAPPVICGKKRIPFAWFLAGAIMALFAFAAAGCEQRPSEQTAQTQPQSFPVLEALDGERLQEAKQMTARCCVRLDVAGEEAEYYGSGVVWDERDGRLIIATAGHLLKEGEVLRVVFYDGTVTPGRTVGISASLDVGFVEAEWPETPAEADTDAEIPALVSLHQRRFDTLDAYSPLFVMASTPDGCADLTLEASLLERAWYREEFGSDVMILSSSAQEGASGAGVFDGCGNFVGLVLGGTQGQTAVLSMEQVNQAGAEIYGSLRGTEDYEAE